MRGAATRAIRYATRAAGARARRCFAASALPYAFSLPARCAADAQRWRDAIFADIIFFAAFDYFAITFSQTAFIALPCSAAKQRTE